VTDANTGIRNCGQNAATAAYDVTLGNLAAGTYKLYFDADSSTVGSGGILAGTIIVIDATAPTSVSWSTGTTQIGSYSDQSYTLTFKDSLGRVTAPVNNEKAVLASSGATAGSGTTTFYPLFAGQTANGTDTIDKADTASSTAYTYTVGIDTDSAQDSATKYDPVSGTVYTFAAQLQDGNSALAAPVNVTYKYMASTVGLAGTLGFYSANTTTATETTTISTTTGVASENLYAKLIDDGGRLVEGATVSYTSATVTANAIAAGTTLATGFTGAFTVTVTAGTTGTVTAAVSTGGATISKSLSVSNSAVATVGPASIAVSSPTTDIYAEVTTATAAVTKLNPATITGTVVVSGTGATASSALALDIAAVDAGANPTFTANGITVDENTAAGATLDKTVYVTTDASGKFTLTLDFTDSGLGNGDTVAITSQAPIVAAGATFGKITLQWETAALAFTTTPATGGKAVKKLGEAVSVAISAVDQYGNGFANYIGSAKMAGVATGTSTTVTGATATGRTGLDGKLTLSVAAPSATFAGDATLTTTLLNPSGAASGAAASTVTVTFSTDGTAATLAVTDADDDADTLTTDNKATRAVIVNPAANLPAAGNDNTDNHVTLTVASTTPAGVAFTATATNGIRLFTTDVAGAALAAGKSEVTGTAGVTTVYAVPTKIGAGTITFVGGGKTVTYTLTGALAAAPLAGSVTLTVAANAGGKATIDLKTLDALGNGVPATVDVVVTGPAYLSNGFKNFQVSSASATGTNSFDLVASGTAGVVTVTATITNATYQAVTAVNAAATVSTTSDQDTALEVTIKSDGASASPTDAAVAAVKTDVTSVRADVKAVSDTVATLSKAVTTIQSSVTELTSSFATQIKSLTDAIAKISKAIAALSKKVSAKK
jgi:hypothetical protein